MDHTLKALALLVDHATALQFAGHSSAAGEITRQALDTLSGPHPLKDADVRLVFAALMGFFSCAAVASPTEIGVTIRDMLAAAVNDGNPDALRDAVNLTLNQIKSEPKELTCQ